MKSSADDPAKVSLGKRPYTVIYPCCYVLAMGLEVTPCWSCGLMTGVSYHDIPLRHHELMDIHRDYRQGTSTIYMTFSKVKAEFLKCPHP